jgi:recombination protein RecA
MNAAVTKKEIESALVDRFGHVFERYERLQGETLPTGIAEIDNAWPGFPRGAITEIHGVASSGRTSLMLSALATATSHEETCALVDCSDTFDLSSATEANVDFDRLLWIRCGHNLERAFKAVDLILHAGGFGFVALNLCDVPAQTVRRVISTWWFRFRRALENTPNALIVLTPIAAVRSGAALALEVKSETSVWPSSLSLVSENSYSSFTARSEKESRLSLVQTSAATISSQTHSHFLQAMNIRVNRERPLECNTREIKFKANSH